MKPRLPFAIAFLALVVWPSVGAAQCLPTGYVQSGTPMTAAAINPTDPVTGEVNAAGCTVGVYYDHNGGGGMIKGADIHGATWFGVFVNGDAGDVSVDVLNSTIRDIGSVPHNGAQRGIAVYYRAFFSSGTATGRIAGNTISGYQKGGVVANGPGTQVQIMDNTVTGDGHVTFIAQNGIQIGYGATASVMRNHVSGNSYIGPVWASGGIIVVGGAGYGTCPDGNPCPLTVNTRIVDNVIADNDVGVYLSNWDFGGAPSEATNIKVVNNNISNSRCFNVEYQAGISDVGNNDKIINNRISGNGYTSCATYAVAVDADASFTNRPKVHANK